MNRRDFLKGAGAALVPAAIPGAMWGSRWPAIPAAPAPNPSRELSPIAAVVYDERYSDSKLFAASLLRRGATLFPARGDSAALWYGFLRPHLARTGGWVAGLTSDADLVVSRTCGRELHLKLVYEGAHDGRASAGLPHRFRSRAGERDIVAALGRSDAAWPTSLADALARIPAAEWRRINSAPSCRAESTHDSGRSLPLADHVSDWNSIAATLRSPDHPAYLTSWLLAPALMSLDNAGAFMDDMRAIELMGF